MKKTIYKVGGMSCGGCAASLKRAIHKEDPNAAIDVDLVSTLVTMSTKLEPSDVQGAVESAGFEFGGVVT